MTRTIHTSYIRRENAAGDYELKHEWDDIFVQAGADGLVISYTGDGDYTTAFFEAFPRNPDTFIRGEGDTIAEAEESCWKQWQKAQACPGHKFDRRGYKNGGGFCIHCNMWSSKAFEPSTLCHVCETPTYYPPGQGRDLVL